MAHADQPGEGLSYPDWVRGPARHGAGTPPTPCAAAGPDEPHRPRSPTLRPNRRRVDPATLADELAAGRRDRHVEAVVPGAARGARRRRPVDARRGRRSGAPTRQDQASRAVGWPSWRPGPGGRVARSSPPPARAGRPPAFSPRPAPTGRSIAVDVHPVPARPGRGRSARPPGPGQRCARSWPAAGARPAAARRATIRPGAASTRPCSGLGVLRRRPDARWGGSAAAVRPARRPAASRCVVGARADAAAGRSARLLGVHAHPRPRPPTSPRPCGAALADTFRWSLDPPGPPWRPLRTRRVCCCPRRPAPTACSSSPWSGSPGQPARGRGGATGRRASTLDAGSRAVASDGEPQAGPVDPLRRLRRCLGDEVSRVGAGRGPAARRCHGRPLRAQPDDRAAGRRRAACRHTDLFLDCHLMVDNPGSSCPRFADAGADRCIVHVELGDPRPLFRELRDRSVQVGLGVEPRHPLRRRAPVPRGPRPPVGDERAPGLRRPGVHPRRPRQGAGRPPRHRRGGPAGGDRDRRRRPRGHRRSGRRGRRRRARGRLGDLRRAPDPLAAARSLRAAAWPHAA